MSQKTLSEKLFEEFCTANIIECVPVTPDEQVSRKNPDYCIKCSDNTVVIEVKEIDSSQSPIDRARRQRLRQTGSTGTFTPQLDERVRKKIDRAMPQLRRLAKGEFPAVLVLYDNGSLLPLDGREIGQAMYGQQIVDISLLGDDNTDPKLFINNRFGAGQKVTATHNTTLSAVALLTRHSDQTLRLAFYHNKFAAKPLNPEWIRIPTIEHFRFSERPQEGGLIGWELIQ